MKHRQVLILMLAAALAASSVLAGCGGSTDASKAASASAASDATDAADADDADDVGDGDEDDFDEEDFDEEDAEQAEYDAWLAALPLAEDDEAVEDCIRLGDYKGLKLTKEITRITDEAVESYAKSSIEPEELKDANATVQTGDTANIAYVGEKDGVAFDGGTSDSYDLEIGSGTFIDGFEDGVIGMKKGETKDLDLTFPEDYGSEELAGQKVVFHVTVNSISRPGEITDADLAAARAELEEDYDQEAVTVMQTDAWQQVKDNSEVLKLRKKAVDEYLAQAELELSEWIESLGMTKEQYLEEQGLSEDEYDQEMELYAREMALEDILVEALAKAEGISTEDQEYKDRLEELAAESDITADELISQAGEGAVRQYIMTERLMNRIIGYAEITEKEVEMEEDDFDDYDYIDLDDYDDVDYEEDLEDLDLDDEADDDLFETESDVEADKDE